MDKYQPTIGLEVHAILKTRTKMFCDSVNDPEEREANKNVCPICLGHPGCLPVINKQAVESVLRVGLALGGTPAPVTKFDRKNYFYPDLPKGYQISQYDQPLISGGMLAGVRIRRIHLEEDAGRLSHEIAGETKKGEASYVDFNRAGVPLMELVTEPDIRSADQALEFGRQLQRILRYLGVSDADMEKGQLRLEANVSLDMGDYVELKNINSFRFVGAAVAYEINRQRELLEKGERVVKETRGWDEAKQKTVSQRSKEAAHDYRYFPEPDLPPFETAAFDLDRLKAELPELPDAKRARFEKDYGLAEGDALRFFIDQPFWGDYFERFVSELDAWIEALPATDEAEAAAKREMMITSGVNYLTTNLAALLKTAGTDRTKVQPKDLARLVSLIATGKIGSAQAKTILAKMFETGTDPEEIMRDEGLETVTDDGAVIAVIQEVMAENPQAVADFRAGKAASLQFMIGKAMAKLRGRANPAQLKTLFETQLTAR
jgi:aspartyl-tRNA(Asn)/glutamyl-tRNA(Gln) amidotransferase subunit B